MGRRNKNDKRMTGGKPKPIRCQFENHFFIVLD